MGSRTETLHTIIERIRELLHVPQRLSEMHDSIQQQTEAIRASDERQKQDREIQPVWLDPVIAKYDQAEGKKAANENKHYRVQNSLRWATWCAFIAASIYAGVTILMWRDANKNFVASQRAWVGVSMPISIKAIDFISANPKATWVVTIKNFGPSVARHIWINSIALNSPVDLLRVQDRICRQASMWSKGQFVDIYHTPAQGLGDDLFPSEEYGRWFEDVPFAQLSPIGNGNLYIVGCLAYMDQFGKERETRYCYWYRTDARKASLPILLYQFYGANESN